MVGKADFNLKIISIDLILNVDFLLIRDYEFSIYADFFEKLTILTPRYAHVRLRIKGVKMLVFGKFCVCTEWMNPK